MRINEAKIAAAAVICSFLPLTLTLSLNSSPLTTWSIVVVVLLANLSHTKHCHRHRVICHSSLLAAILNLIR